MSDQQATEKITPARRAAIRVRVDKLRQSRQRSILGVAEIAGLAGSAVMLLAVIFVYLYFYSPAEARLVTAQLERARLRERFSILQKERGEAGTESTLRVNYYPRTVVPASGPVNSVAEAASVTRAADAEER